MTETLQQKIDAIYKAYDANENTAELYFGQTAQEMINKALEEFREQIKSMLHYVDGNESCCKRCKALNDLLDLLGEKSN